jgi:biopolymer transport protein ExbB
MLAIDTAYFHHVCINTLYGAAVLLTFVLAERLIYFVLLNWRTSSLGAVLHGSQAWTDRRIKRRDQVLKRRDLMSRTVSDYIAALSSSGFSRTRLEDLSSAQFIKVHARINARLWLLDTIVTAAPLLGLLGTILGIMDTFSALSAGGISDPGAVSRGIGAALLATAIGIGVALFGLLGHNLLHRFADHILEEFKRLILLSESSTPHAIALEIAKAARANGLQDPVLPTSALLAAGATR